MLITNRGKLVATVAHGACGHIRRYSGKDYIIHPIEVADILMGFGFGDDLNLITASYLHDVIEDTKLTLEYLDNEFNGDVADIVYQVTNPSKHFPDLSRAERKLMDLNFLSQADVRPKALKLADIISNAPDIIKEDPEFANVWVNEALAIVDTCKKYDELTELHDHAVYILNTFIRYYK